MSINNRPPLKICINIRNHWLINAVEERRIAARLSQEQLSKKVNKSRAWWGRYTAGVCSCRAIYAIEACLDALGYKLVIRKIQEESDDDAG